MPLPYVTPVVEMVTLYDPETNRFATISENGALNTNKSILLCGGGFGSALDPYTNSSSVIGSGTVVVSDGQSLVSTGTTTGSSAKFTTTRKARQQYGRVCLANFLMTAPAQPAGCTVEWGIEVDANNSFGFRITGGQLSVFAMRAGVTTSVLRADFNGNDNGKFGTYNIDSASVHEFSIEYTQSRITFIVNNEAQHTFTPTLQSLGRQTGRPYLLVSNGATTVNASIVMLGMVVSAVGALDNIPKFYAYTDGLETRTLKATAGTLIGFTITRAATSNATVTIYDSTTGSGTLIAVYDVAKLETIGDHFFGPNGLSFDNGLTYVVAGSPAALSFTVMWE